MKILIITTRFYPHIGGVEEVVSNIAKNLSKDNDVRVLSSLDAHTGLSKIDKILKISLPEKNFGNYKNKRIWINIPHSVLGVIIFPTRFLLALIELFSYVIKFKPDVINYHFPDDSSVYVSLLCSILKTPLVVNIHGNDLHIFSKKPIHKLFIRNLLNCAAKIIVNSAYMKSEFEKSYPSLAAKVKIIPNGLNVDLYSKSTSKPYINDPYIFYVGRIVEKKGVDLLVKAFYKLKDLGLKLIIEGTGEELDKIKDTAKKLGIEQQVIFTNGKLSTDEKISTMRNALFGVIPSRIEPFGIVALEFMATETPFIASKTGGLNDLLKDGETCLFFENGNIDDLASKMESMLNDRSLRESLSKNGKNEVQKYKWESISDKYLSCFNEIL